jgi:NifU-like protein involved in Fe-S cluster formation
MDDLYHPRILELAGDIPHVGRLDAPDGASTKVSRVCGSVVTVELKLADGVVSEIAVHPKACALGQAATGVFAPRAMGCAQC